MFREWSTLTDRTSQVVRFLGSTPHSTDVTLLLRSLTQNVIDILSPDVTLPREFSNLPSVFEELCSLFRSVLTFVPSESKLVIILDAIDELAPSAHAFDLNWFPVRLPRNVKLIASVLDEGYDLIDRLNERNFPISNYISVSGLSAQASLALLNHWMTKHQRSLTSHQWKSIAVTLGRKAHRPLYLRLLLDELLKWHSYDKTYLRAPPRDVTVCIRRHFERLAEVHGNVLVAHVFSLLAVSKEGLSQQELEDILSLDEEVRVTNKTSHLIYHQSLVFVCFRFFRAFSKEATQSSIVFRACVFDNCFTMLNICTPAMCTALWYNTLLSKLHLFCSCC